MQRKLKFTPTADAQLMALEDLPSKAALLAQVRKALGYLEIDPRHPGLRTHEFIRLRARMARRSSRPTRKTILPAPTASSGITAPMKSKAGNERR